MKGPFTILALLAWPLLAAAAEPVCGFQFPSGQGERQRVTRAFCVQPTGARTPCRIPASTARDAPAIGVEDVINAAGFRALPPEEQKLWHRHAEPPGPGDPTDKAWRRAFATTYGRFEPAFGPQGPATTRIPMH